MRAIFIDAKNRKVQEINFEGDFQAIQKQIGVDTFTVCGMRDNDACYVDDEGLLNGTKDFFSNPNIYPHPLAGNGLILGTDDEGESTDCKVTLDSLGPVRFYERSAKNILYPVDD